MTRALIVAGCWLAASCGLALLIGRAIRLADAADSLPDYWVDDAPLTRP